MIPVRQILLSACVLNFGRHTIAEAKVSVDRLHALVEQCYGQMSSRVRALEVLNMQKIGDADWTSGDDTESLPTIHARPPGSIWLDSGEVVESELVRFDFSDDLQKSRVYRRNQAFRETVISALTNSVYSLGWSFFSDLSMAEVSNISVINLAITEGETSNPRRYSQTWSAQPDREVSANDYVDEQLNQLNKVAREPVQAKNSATIARGRGPAATEKQSTSDSSLRQLPNAQEISREAPSESDQQLVTARMEARCNSILPPIPTRIRSKTSEDQGQRPLHFNFDEMDFEKIEDHSRPQLFRPAADDHQQLSLPRTRSPLPDVQPSEYLFQCEDWVEVSKNETDAHNSYLTTTLSPADTLYPLSTLQSQATSLIESHELMEDKAAHLSSGFLESPLEEDEGEYLCKGCGEVCHTS